LWPAALQPQPLQGTQPALTPQPAALPVVVLVVAAQAPEAMVTNGNS